jgi:hypothetical protein
MLEKDGESLNYTLVTTERSNAEGNYGASLLDMHLNPVYTFLSPARNEVLKKLNEYMSATGMQNITGYEGLIPYDLKEMLIRERADA